MNGRTNLKAWLVISVFFVAAGVGTSSVFATGTYDDHDGGVRVDRGFGKMPLYFIENEGQLDEEVGFYVQGSDKTLYFTPQGVTFALAGKKAESEETQRWVVKLDFVGANPDVRPRGENRQQAVISYFKGNREDWKTGLPTYSRIVYPELWDGIDLVYSGSVNRLKYEFVVEPGADAKQIRLAYCGAGNVTINKAGELTVDTPLGGFADAAPYAYQEMDGRRAEVAMAYTAEEESCEGIFEYGFDIGPYDTSRPLILDPAVLVYCGYIGGDGWEEGSGLAVDDSGSAYVTGWTDSTEASFPVDVGPDLTYNGGTYDAFVAKVNAAGTGLVYCGYIGGSDDEYAWRIAVDADGNAYVAGRTSSTEASFPVHVGPDLTYNGGTRDAFVAKVNAGGTGLDYCGYIGGDSLDSGSSIVVDDSGNAYVAGYTWSTQASFPVVVGPGLTHDGSADAFVAKIKADGTGLDYCGYIGGSSDDYGEGIAVDDTNNAYVTGHTRSMETDGFPVVVGPDLTYNGGYSDAFVAKVNASGATLNYCGYIGGSDSDSGAGIAVDDTNNAYVTGNTESTEANFPEVVGPDLTSNGGADAFVAKVNASGTTLDYCGYIGGAGMDHVDGIALDDSGNAYVTGYTCSTEASFPVVVGPDLTYNGGTLDAFVAKVKDGGTGLDYCGYIGGSGNDYGFGIAVDAAGNAYVTGRTSSAEANFPVVTGPDLTHNDGYYDAFVAKISRWPTDIYYVDVDANGANDGTSWEDAFNYLQDALAVAMYGDEIRVAEGVYKPDEDTAHPNGTGDREATFQLIDGVAIRGGYAGFGEADPNARDVSAYETILSGDLDGNDTPGLDPCDLPLDPNRYENSILVVTGIEIGPDTILDGFVIVAGYDFGGMSNYSNSRPQIVNCTFMNNVAYVGGGMYNQQSDPNITNCTFIGNIAAYDGGGMYNTDESQPTLNNCTFSDNVAYTREGGGIYSGRDSSSTLTNCTFIGNVADAGGGGMISFSDRVTLTNCAFVGNSAYSGGAMAKVGGIATVTNCTFTGNLAEGSGGGMVNISESATVTNCTFVGNWAGDGGGAMTIYGSSATVTNCTFTGNWAGDRGGAMWNASNSPTVTNCTFTGNSAGNEGGAMCSMAGNLTLTNCILWGDTGGGLEGNEIALYGEHSTIDVNYCDVQGGQGDIYNNSGGTLNWGTGNIDIDPCFVDPGRWVDANDANVVVEPNDPNAMWVDGDYHLLLGSPCIDRGDNNSLPADIADLDGDGDTNEAIPWDLDGNARIVDGNSDGNAVVDMGAYEYFVPPVEVSMRFTPRALNPGSKGKWLKAHFVLPEGYTVEDVDVESPAKITEPFEPDIDSNYVNVFINDDDLVEVEAAFERSVFCGADISDETTEVIVVGSFMNGQQFYGTDTIKVTTNYFKHLELLASYWLERECDKPDWCEGADLNHDSVVDFADLALFAGCCIEVVGE